jgi:signal transduction histidine kinase
MQASRIADGHSRGWQCHESMKIRTRLNLWYSIILCIIALAVIAAATYHEFVIEKRHHHHGSKSESELDSEDLIDILTWTVTPAFVLGVGGGWWITRKALAPVTALTEAVEKIHDRNLSEPLARTGNGDEIDRLTEVFNAMTARLDGSFQRIHEFTLHASHELKTPLTVMRGELETTLREADLKPLRKEQLLSQIDEIERLSKIVDGLTLLTKADAGQIKLRQEPVQFDDLVHEIVADAKILAQPQNIRVDLDVCEAISLFGDRHRLRQLLLNLAENAVKYNQPGGTVKVSLRRVNDFAELKIENTGPGIAIELQARVFERFFRGDASHSNRVEGCGLGLSIAQWIVTAHNGSIQFVSDKLTTVTARLPCR